MKELMSETFYVWKHEGLWSTMTQVCVKNVDRWTKDAVVSMTRWHLNDVRL